MAVAVALIVIVLVILLIVLLTGFRIVLEYERGVIFRLGRCVGAKGPGLFYIIPILDRMRKVNLQTQAVPVASQQVITKDNVTVAVDAVAYFRVRDPVASVIKIQNWFSAAQLVARRLAGQHVDCHERVSVVHYCTRFGAHCLDLVGPQPHRQEPVGPKRSARPRKMLMISTGIGKMIVEFRSVAISAIVCSVRSCMAPGLVLIVAAA